MEHLATEGEQRFMTADYRFRTVDFRPAPEGWRTAWITADGLEVTPMPGWLVREEAEWDDSTDEPTRSTGYRDVVATRLEDNGIEAITPVTDTSFWFILGPGEREPTEVEVAAEIARRKAARGSEEAP